MQNQQNWLWLVQTHHGEVFHRFEPLAYCGGWLLLVVVALRGLVYRRRLEALQVRQSLIIPALSIMSE
jgi:hypothetical protein